jgi:hypothetical protein
MASFKRGRTKSRRSGCLMCKPWKHQRCAKHKRMKFSDMVRAERAKSMVCEAVG